MKTGAPQKKSFIKFQSRNKATSPEFMTDNRVFVAKDNWITAFLSICMVGAKRGFSPVEAQQANN